MTLKSQLSFYKCRNTNWIGSDQSIHLRETNLLHITNAIQEVYIQESKEFSSFITKKRTKNKTNIFSNFKWIPENLWSPLMKCQENLSSHHKELTKSDEWMPESCSGSQGESSIMPEDCQKNIWVQYIEIYLFISLPAKKISTPRVSFSYSGLLLLIVIGYCNKRLLTPTGVEVRK